MTRSPLHALHERLEARFVDFSGWEMPVQYEGTIGEHKAVRTSAGIFDVSHLGRFALAGSQAGEVARRLLCNDVADIEPGRAQYTMMLNEDGGIVDDIIVWRLDDDDYLILPNAGNYPIVMEAFAAAATGDTAVTPLRENTAMLAVQGPEAPAAVERVLGVKPGHFRVVEAAWDGGVITIAGTGYTGERGAELLLDGIHAASLFSALVDEGVVPCGLGARDTLRLEMGYPLWGQDLDPVTTPLEAGLGWVVDWDHDFVGKQALEAQRDGGPDRCLIGFALADRRVPRQDHPLRCGGSTGTVSSGNFSPMLEVGIGMGYVSPPPDDGQVDVEVEIRGRPMAAKRVDPPFLER